MSKTIVPCVDLQDFLSGDSAKRKNFISTLGKAYEEVGFVSVVNHGLTDAEIEKLYTKVTDFFSMQSPTKRQYEIEGLAGQRGYTSFGKESAKQSDVPDLKEFFQFGQTVAEDSALKSRYPENVQVSEVAEFNDTLVETYRKFEQSGAHLLRAIALYLGLEEEYFTPHITEGNSILRCIHYPPITEDPISAIRAEQHEDINLITLLVGASADGLELLNKQDEWVAVNAGPGEIVVNVGDMLQRLTNNKLRSTTHRVVNPPREKWHTHRYSIPFFLHPKAEMKLDCLDSCVSEDRPLAYDPITAGEYLEERLIEIGLLKKA